jgi:hypothetical protein
MNWITIDNKLINLDAVTYICAKRAEEDIWNKPLLSFQFHNGHNDWVFCESEEEALELVNQLAMYLKPVVIECRK